jgi:hypothetical protein
MKSFSIRIFFSIPVLFPSLYLFSQKPLPVHAIQILGGYSKHGSGDLNGIVFGAGYRKYIFRQFSLNFELRSTINDGKETILVTNNYYSRDASIRYLSAGVQLGINGGFSIIRNSKHEFLISLGGFGRYQSETPDGYELYYPNRTGQPTVLVEFENVNPQETFSVGVLFQLQYNFTIKNKFLIGFGPGIQTDTNGDIIPQVSLSLGRRLL